MKLLTKERLIDTLQADPTCGREDADIGDFKGRRSTRVYRTRLVRLPRAGDCQAYQTWRPSRR